jgi:hypothetical protein
MPHMTPPVAVPFRDRQPRDVQMVSRAEITCFAPPWGRDRRYRRQRRGATLARSYVRA